MFLKKDYTFEELLKEERVVYFDIDGTLGGSINMHKYKMKKEYQSKKRAEMNEMFKRIGVYTFSLGDYTSMDKESLALFKKLLIETNAKAVCISSWVTTMCLREKGDKTIEEFSELDMLNEVFRGTFKEWSDDLIVGGIDFHYNRGKYLKQLIKKHNIKGNHIVLDDGAGRGYPENDLTVSVDSQHGFSEKEYEILKRKLTCTD